MSDLSTDTVGCPCCGDPMSPANVVCWTCYRLTNRLQPGTYPDVGGTFEITEADVARYDALRARRTA